MYVKECGRIGTVREPRSRALARTMSEVRLTSGLTPPTTERRSGGAAEQRRVPGCTILVSVVLINAHCETGGRARPARAPSRERSGRGSDRDDRWAPRAMGRWAGGGRVGEGSRLEAGGWRPRCRSRRRLPSALFRRYQKGLGSLDEDATPNSRPLYQSL